MLLLKLLNLFFATAIFPEATRTKLFKSLIESRLFFGLGAWTTPTARQMNKLQAALTHMLRKLFRMSTEEISTTTVPDLFQRANICSRRGLGWR